MMGNICCYCVKLVKNLIAEIGAIRAKNVTVTAHKGVNKQNLSTKQLNLN